MLTDITTIITGLRGVVACEPSGYHQIRAGLLRRVMRVRVCHRVMTRSGFAFRGRTYERLDGYAATCCGLVEIPTDVSRREVRVPAGALAKAGAT